MNDVDRLLLADIGQAVVIILEFLSGAIKDRDDESVDAARVDLFASLAAFESAYPELRQVQREAHDAWENLGQG